VYSTLFMRRQLPDPEVRRRAWPDYTFGCKRILFSSHYLPALGRDNVELVTDRVTEVVADGVRTADGRHHPADVLIWGTGFRAGEFMFPMDIVGRDGRTLQDEWGAGAHAHYGITVPGFPSLFVLYGPNTNTSGGSIIVFLEAQVAYVRQALEETARRRAAALEVRRDVEEAFDQRIQAEFEGTAWTRCDSWYRDASGRIVANWPRYMEEYVRAVSRLEPTDYDFHPVPR
jgi:cation diffusion facilitator CzcD-associated flavoprotein CzcO